MLSFVLNKFGNKELIVDGYLYSKQYVGKKEITWRCCKYEASSCPAKAYTTSCVCAGDLRLVGEHNHGGDIIDIEVKKTLSKMKRRAKKSTENTKTVVCRSTANVASPVAAALPRIHAMRRQVQRVRHSNRPYLATPARREDLDFPEVFTKTWKGDQFLLYDSEGKNRLLIFSTQKNLEYLGLCKVILCDGTFFSVPDIFAQLYSIHGYTDDGKVLLLVFILTPDRKRKNYKTMLTVLQDLSPNLNPETIMVDFKKSFIEAAISLFPNAHIGGCNFHFNQCLQRHVKEYGLSIMYNNDICFARAVEMMAALAYVSLIDIITAYDQLCHSEYFTDNEDTLRPLLDYFSSTWIGVPTARGRQKPKFSHDI